MNLTDLLNPYAYAMRLRRTLYRRGILKSEHVSVPVISIGNLSMGGTGKTPMTLSIARYCSECLNKKPAIILRGYKRRSTGYLLVSDSNTILETVQRSGDEAQLYARALPRSIVVCDEDRIRGANNAIALGAEVILLDDGYQHLRLKRDLNILLINSDEGVPPLFPFSKGRESASAIDEADIIIQTNYSENAPHFFHTDNKRLLLTRTLFSRVNLYSEDEEIDALPEILNGARILVLSGIANPERFERPFAEITSTAIPYRLHDHAEYDTAILKKIVAKAKKEKCEFIATTTKDAAKMLYSYIIMQQQDASLPNLAVVHMEIEFIQGEEILKSRISDLFRTHQ